MHKTPSVCAPKGKSARKVRLIGLEPTRLATPDPKSGASTNFATSAFLLQKYIMCHDRQRKGRTFLFSGAELVFLQIKRFEDMNFVLSSHLAAYRLASPRLNSGGWWTVLLCSLLCALPLSARNKIADAMKSDKMEVFASKNVAWTSTPVGQMADPAVPTAQPAMVVIAADGKETEETGYDGSAPLRVRFEARATDYGTRTPLYEWQFHREGVPHLSSCATTPTPVTNSPRAARSPSGC